MLARTHAHTTRTYALIYAVEKGRIPSKIGEVVEGQMADGLEGDNQAMAERLEVQFGQLREEMLLYGFR